MTHILEIGFSNKVFCLCFRNFRIQTLQFIIKLVKDFVLFEKSVVYLCYYRQNFLPWSFVCYKKCISFLTHIFLYFQRWNVPSGLKRSIFGGNYSFLRGNKNCARGLVLKIVSYLVFKHTKPNEKKTYPQNNTNVPKNKHIFFAQVGPLVMFIYFFKHCS